MITRYVIADLETIALPNAADYLDPVRAAANLRDPVKIEADITARSEAQLAECALDWNVGRIATIGLLTEREREPRVLVCLTEDDERRALREFWSALDITPESTMTRRVVIGFCVRTFDLPFIIQRSRYLDVPRKRLSVDRYRNDDVLDIFSILTFDDLRCTSAMRRTLRAFARRIGLDVPDDIAGGDVAEHWRAGDVESVVAHVRCDVLRTAALARWLDLIPKEQPHATGEAEARSDRDALAPDDSGGRGALQRQSQAGPRVDPRGRAARGPVPLGRDRPSVEADSDRHR
jgi:hypothetical protein